MSFAFLSRWLAAGCAGLVLLVASSCARPDAGGSAPVAAAGAPAPAWTLRDLDGREVKSTDFSGKLVVVDFWATWCGPCRAEIPGYIALQKKYAERGLVIVGISLDQAGPARVREFVAKQGMNYPVVMGDDAVVAAFGNIEAIPTTFLIDRSGRIIHQKTGTWSHEAYEQLVRDHL